MKTYLSYNDYLSSPLCLFFRIMTTYLPYFPNNSNLFSPFPDALAMDIASRVTFVRSLQLIVAGVAESLLHPGAMPWNKWTGMVLVLVAIGVLFWNSVTRCQDGNEKEEEEQEEKEDV